MEDLKTICKPVIDYLIKKYDPYVEIVITSEGITVKQDIMGIPAKGDQSGN